MAERNIQEITEAFQGEIPGGMAGERIIRQRARTGILERASREDVLRPRLSIEEMNDLLAYYSWSIWNMLALRATEGESGLIPRQEYESLAFLQQFFLYPRLMEAIARKVGPEGVIALGEGARREIGTKVNLVRNFCLPLTAMLGRGLLIRSLQSLEPGDRLSEIHTVLQFSRQLLWGYRGDGYLFSSQDGYRSPILERAWIDRFQREAEPLDREENRQTFRELNAVTELLGFLVHFDCRAGLGDTGPYDLGDGKLLIVRDHFLREDVYHWCDVCEGLPYAVTLAFILDAGRMGLKEIRVNDISTTFTWPRNYSPHITHAAYYVRPEWDSRPEEIRQIGFSEARDLTRQAREATLKLYKKLSRMSRRQLITNGIYVYVVDLVLPYARLTGLYETFCRDFDLWELNPEVSAAYYRFCRDEFRFGFFPGFLAGGEAFIPIPTQAYW